MIGFRSVPLLLAFFVFGALAVLPRPFSAAQAAGPKLAELVRFTDYETGPVEDWLQGKGFKFEQDARNRSRIDLDVGETGLTVEAKRAALGLMPNEAVNVPDFTHIEIDWGVNRFPKGASYETGRAQRSPDADRVPWRRTPAKRLDVHSRQPVFHRLFSMRRG